MFVPAWLRPPATRLGFAPARCSPVRRTACRPRLTALEDRSVSSAGMPDPTFGSGAAVITNSSSLADIYQTDSVAIQADGKIIVAWDRVTSGDIVFGADALA